MAVPSEYLSAIRKYAPSVDGLARKRYGISGAALLAKTLKGESGFSMKAVSNVGARGGGQFMPGSRKVAMDRYGVDPWRSPDEAVHGMALHLRGKINGSEGLEGYNPGGGQGYVKYILGQKVGDLASARAGGSQGNQTHGTPGLGETGTKIVGADTSALTGLVEKMSRPQVSVTGPSAPGFAASQALPSGYQQVASSTPLAGQGSTSSLAAQIAALAGQTTKVQTAAQPSSQGGQMPSSSRTPRPGGGFQGTQAPARQLAQIGLDLGLKVMSEKRNNTNPYSGSRSDHDNGNKDAYAYDISSGNAPNESMDRAAFRIMRALGFKNYKMGQPINTSQGVVEKNGLRFQVIYRGSGAAYGGNHLNHVHIGVKRIGR